ncbi:Esterase, SGNH hydrolase-type, subgroup [Cordyceps fumosorosea ARSEF 2679]|uniref:Esterase, SGNH hydrolase-type, subgroup n=1 Tax=Cordyceps fumosorosea (strain ARSEF 2679) TaxID=1081104 RepID=A0A168DCU6_CORFA|nr:Esterase, SGNH hydrolase-type, subgroup [Cordyceps fumosorosea ARSEF 2679]OAA72448.1 Esterase, SGNH hydrolase-type, subgroup [Cordyceps fumosorosea ARSEF 2679]
MTTKINTSRFYFEYKGHDIADLTTFFNIVTAHRPGAPIVYLAGDSSLDNKYWLPTPPTSSRRNSAAPADHDDDAVPEIYHLALQTPRPKADVAFWLNRRLGSRATALNLAVEASLLRERDGAALLPHDEFIRDRITPEDVLVVSVGGNDIAMRPTPWTVLHMLWLAWLTPLSSIRSGRAWALRYFVRLFKTRTEAYIEKMVAKTKPRAVIVCMVYYPLEALPGSGISWADKALAALGYNGRPGRLQAGIQQMYEQATRRIKVAGVRVDTCPLFEALDGKNAVDYEERVEPSVQGGRKMAGLLGPIIDGVLVCAE